MTIYSFPLSNTSSIKLWDLTPTTATVQYCSSEKKSRKSVSTIKTYNGRQYINCLGHRYYLDKFSKIEI